MSTAQPDHQPETGFLRFRKSRLAWFGLLTLAILAAIVFITGNRGGEDAWQQYRRELEAKGEKLDWEAFIPPAIPDGSNFYKAPGMTAWFSKQVWQSNKVAIFELPAWVRDRPITLEQLRALPEKEDAGDTAAYSSGSREKLREWFTQLDAEYRLLVDASARPLVRFDAAYRDSVAMDIPNFVNQRQFAQALASHANLSVLDGKGDVAVQDLFMMRRLAELSGSSPTLLGAMMRVAIMDLYAQTARDALEAGAFSEAQLKAIQAQLRDVNLLQDYAQSLRAERAIQVRLLNLPPADLSKLLRRSSTATAKLAPLWQFDLNAWLRDLRLKISLRSRSWVAANLVFICRAHQDALDQVDLVRPRIHAAAHSLVVSNFQLTFVRTPSYAQLAAIVMPIYSRSAVTAARHQTQLDQLRVATALERYRLKRGDYPEALEALIPDFLDRLPNDLFADQPLQYRRDTPSGYQLWSVGWDEKDDQGTTAFDKVGVPVYSEQPGDWVWRKSPGL